MSQKIKFWRPGDSSPQQNVLQERQTNTFDSSILYKPTGADLSLDNQRKRLPIHNYRSHIIYLLENNRTLIIVGETGCGKSTQIPQYLVESGWATSENQKIAITEPRRVAAVSLASRVADERVGTLGLEVGYAIRFDECYDDKKTLIKFMTDGVLLREMMTDPLLKQYSVIMVDEAHERSINTDMCIGLLKKIQKRRPELRLIVASATIDAEKFFDFFNVKDEQENDSCAILSVEGRVHPVETFYSVDPVPDYVTATVKTIMEIHLSPKEGDILAFLTGQEEVDRAVAQVQEQARSAAKNGMKKYLIVMPMYSTLPIHEQQKIFEKVSRNARKVVISTNIAETSITVNGVVFVVDCGFVKIKAYNPHTGIESLMVNPTSKASALQRAGRAGRCRLGEAYRLYTEEDYDKLDDITVPEMQRTSLVPVLLQLKSLGVENVVRFDFLSPPPAQCMINAMETLYALGAINENGSLTQPLGFQMSEFPLGPQFAKMILNSETFECSEEIITIAAMLQVNTVFSMSARTKTQSMKEHRKFAVAEGDHITMLNVYNAFVNEGNETKRWSNRYCLNFERLKRACQLRKQLEKYLNRFNIKLISCGRDTEKILRCITSGFFANAAKLQMDGSYKSLKGGNTLQIHPTSVLATEQPPQFVIFNEIMQTTSYYMRDISVIKPEWLCELASHYYESGTERSIGVKRMRVF
uniref:probable ATP-dependent RNA helicase DHX35 n=1 Tax=Styela clava TaxID=7725 RepID=UPI001939763A|nr:probable ATP-dependent RNA helicase DHX35 [Styela clava]